MSDFVTVDVRAEAVTARFLGMEKKLHSSLLRAITRLSIELQTKVKEKLTGEVLHVRTGTLRRSINRRIEDEGEIIKAQVGTNVPYAHIHEFGFKGVEDVRAYWRHMASGKVVPVRAHTRNVNVPETSFLRSSLREMRAKIHQDIRDAAIEGLKP